MGETATQGLMDARDDLCAAYEASAEDKHVIGDDQPPFKNGGWLRADVVLFATGYVDGPGRFPFVDSRAMFAPEDESEDDDGDDGDAAHERQERELANAWYESDRGVAEHVPGLYQLGMPWQQRADSSLLRGFSPDAKHLAFCIRRLHKLLGGDSSAPKSHGSFRELVTLNKE